MTNIEQKALELVNEVCRERGRPEWMEIERSNSTCEDALCRAIEQHEALSAENERLREALLFYANNKNYRYIIGTGCTSVDIDAGDTARAALGDTK